MSATADTKVVRARELEPGMQLVALRGRTGKVLVGPRGGRYTVRGMSPARSATVTVLGADLDDRGLHLQFEGNTVTIPRNLVRHYVADVVVA